MTAAQPTCLGCNLSVGFQNYSVEEAEKFIANPSLTFEEQHVLHLLADAYNSFITLPKRSHYDNEEFVDGVHRLQQLVALRVARRVDPHIWKQPDSPQ